MKELTKEDQLQLQNSWNRLHGKELDFIAIFYEELFNAHPSYKDLFSEDIGQQKLKFIEMMNLIINGILHLEALIPTIKILGRKHDELGVLPEDYDNVICVFVDTYGKACLGTSDHELSLWNKALNTLKYHMLDNDE